MDATVDVVMQPVACPGCGSRRWVADWRDGWGGFHCAACGRFLGSTEWKQRMLVELQKRHSG